MHLAKLTADYSRKCGMLQNFFNSQFSLNSFWKIDYLFGLNLQVLPKYWPRFARLVKRVLTLAQYWKKK